MRLYPNGSGKNNMGFVNLFLYLCLMPAGLSKLRVKYSIACNETNTNWNHIKDYKINAMGSGWSNHRLSRDKLFKFNSFSFKCHVAILEKYDINNNKIVVIPKAHEIAPKSQSQPALPINMNINDLNNGIINDGVNDMNDIKQIKKSIKLLNSQMKELQINVNNINNTINTMNNDKIQNDNLILAMLRDIKHDIKKLKENQNISNDNPENNDHQNENGDYL